MRTGIRIISCVMLMAVALTMAVFTLADFDPPAGAYRLGEHQGLVAVYSQASGQPVSITDIELASLRQADREAIVRGIQAETKEELLSLLEDLGS